jgi:hypothetical protein
MLVSFGSGPNSNLSVADANGDPTVGRAAQFAADRDNAAYLQSHGLTHIRVRDLFAINAGWSAWTPYDGGTIYIDASRLMTGSAIQNQAFLMHELIHHLYGMDDTDIQRALGIKVDSTNTKNISDWLRDNCVRER